MRRNVTKDTADVSKPEQVKREDWLEGGVWRGGETRAGARLQCEDRNRGEKERVEKKGKGK